MACSRLSSTAPAGWVSTRSPGSHRGLSHLLDEHDPISGQLHARGLEPRHRATTANCGTLARAVGEPVKIKLRAGVAEDRRLTGTVTEADDDAATIATDGNPTLVAYADIESARTVFVWPGQPKPVKPSRQKHAKAPSPDAATRPTTTDGDHPSPTTKKATR